MTGEEPYGMYADMLMRRRLPARHVALAGLVAAADVESAYLLNKAQHRGLITDEAWADFFGEGMETTSDLIEAWRRFTAPSDFDPDVRGSRNPRDPELLAGLEAALAGFQALLARIRAAAGVTGSSWDV